MRSKIQPPLRLAAALVRCCTSDRTGGAVDDAGSFWKDNSMFGNKKGWMVSAAMVLLWGGLLWLIYSADEITPATAFSKDAVRMGKMQLPIDPVPLGPAMNGAEDAGDLYCKVIADYQTSFPIYKRIIRDGEMRRSEMNKLAAVDYVVRATACKGMTLLEKQPGDIINYKLEKPALTALMDVGSVTLVRGDMAEKEKRLDEARRYYMATFSMGYKLFNERVMYDELSTGLTLMIQAAQSMIKLETDAGNKDKATAYGAFVDACLAYDQESLGPTLKVLRAIDDKRVARHAGDVFAFARTAQERMWRVEATLQLGRYRFNAGRAADQRMAMRELRKLANDPDAVISAAGKAARDLTVEDYRSQGS